MLVVLFDTLGSMEAQVLSVTTDFDFELTPGPDKSSRADAMLKVLVGLVRNVGELGSKTFEKT